MTHVYPGHFITFEGGEGSGKTTQLALLADTLRGLGFPVLQTREPGGTALGDAIRALILNGSKDDPDIDPKTELFLYLASRSQHVTEVIQPALTAGKIVLCDRFTDATLAYQGDGRKLPKEAIEQMTHFASYGLVPELTFFLDLDVQTGLARLKGREEINRMDQETFQFHNAVYQGYHSLARANPKRIVIIDASGTIDAIALKIQGHINAFLS